MSINDIITTYLPANTESHLRGNVIIVPVTTETLLARATALYREHKLPLKLITVQDDRAASGTFAILYVFGIPGETNFLALQLSTTDAFPSLTPTIHEASLYERKIRSLMGLTPTGHPNPQSIIVHENWPADVFPLRKDFAWNTRPETGGTTFEFMKVGGEEGIYELPVGPVHAGIIEPGHFRFNLAGEEILLLEPRLGYSHKGVEKLFEHLPLDKKVALSERIAGDTSFTYSLAFCQALESLAAISVPARALYLRTIYSELERLANHFSDIGAIMTDTGFNFGAAQGARLRERIMRLCDALTDSRFLRGVNHLGGVTRDLNAETSAHLKAEIEALQIDFNEVMAITEDSSTLKNRLEDTGVLDAQIARDHGVTGVAARACGIASDSRVEHPYAAYGDLTVAVASAPTCDVMARLLVRVQETRTSMDLILEALAKLPSGPVSTKVTTPIFAKSSTAVSITEGWRGDIVCFVATDAHGTITRVDMRDPSFLNGPLVGEAGKGNMVPDFPLINKSFSLSYTGGDM